MFLIIIKNMDKFHEELFDVLTRSRNDIKRESMAVSGINKAQMIHDFLNRF
jgi:GTP1/Obg family GTP-binding protein